jgi:hypothetical protein
LKNNKSEGNDKNSPIDVQKLTRHSISVLGRAFDVVDDQHLYGTLRRLQLQSNPYRPPVYSPSYTSLEVLGSFPERCKLLYGLVL